MSEFPVYRDPEPCHPHAEPTHYIQCRECGDLFKTDWRLLICDRCTETESQKWRRQGHSNGFDPTWSDIQYHGDGTDS